MTTPGATVGYEEEAEATIDTSSPKMLPSGGRQHPVLY